MAGENYNNAELRYTTRDLLLAGSHTTSAATQFALILLADNPVVQDRFQKDIDSVVPKDRLPSLADKPKMAYVEATILEMMRWKTLGSAAPPHVSRRDAEVGGYFIPADTLVKTSQLSRYCYRSN